MSLFSFLNSWYGVLGGISGIAVLVYFGVMIFYARKKDRDIQELRIQVAEIKGFLMGKKQEEER